MTETPGESPDLDDLRFDPRKITEYLLSVNHADGQSKARFFLRRAWTVA